jgi:hypothetical protein
LALGRLSWRLCYPARRALDDVFTDRRYIHWRSTSALEIAEHLLAQAAAGERDIDRLKASALAKLSQAA